MSVVVQWVNAPLVALAVMRGVNYSVYGRVSHIDVGARHIYLCTERSRSVSKLSRSHSAEEVKVLLNASVAVRALLAGLGQSASVLLHLVSREVAHVCLAVHNELFSILVALVKVVRAVEDTAAGRSAEPGEVLKYRINVLGVLFCGVGIVVAEVEKSAVLLCGLVVYKDSLCRADMEITVRLGGKTCVDLCVGSFLKVCVNYVVYKIICNLFHCFVLLRLWILF